MPATKTAPETLTTRQIAEALGTDPKTLRVFLRASPDYQAVGAGSRYAFTAKDVGPMKTRFARWLKDREAAKVTKADAAKVEETPAKKTRAAKPAARKAAPVVEDGEDQDDEPEDDEDDSTPDDE